MKQFDILKKSLLVSCLCAAGTVNAQVHPLAFGSQTIGTTATPTNWYADYVGLRLEVVSPTVVAGDKVYKTSNDGNAANTGNWGGFIPTTTPVIINTKIKMPANNDSLGNSIPAHWMDGRVAFIYRGTIEFGTKALHAQQAGAIAVILVNNVGGGPVGMAAGSDGAGVTIPVYMISKADGDAIDARYNNADTASVTITNWGQGFNNDLGFVPGGTALAHDYAIPASQLTNNNPFAYGMIDGAFIANYGNHLATNTKVSTTVTFTPNGGSPTTVHTDVSPTLASFPILDSIYSMFAPSEYNLPQNSQQGRYDMTYTITTDSTDAYPFDNTLTNSFYATANTFCKGRYDFGLTPNQPLRTIYNSFNAGAEFLWGPMYYVANGHVSLQKVQYSLAFNVAQGGDPTLTTTGQCMLFKWVDGWHDSVLNVTYPSDSVMQDGELILVSLGIKPIDATTDTSDALLECTTMRDTDGNGLTPNLDSASWYYMAIDVPAGFFLGADGILDPYPRTYGRFMNSSNGYMDYSNLVGAGDKTTFYVNGSQGEPPMPGTSTAFINSVDSFNYDNAKGLIPQVAMITGPYQSGVKNVKSSFANVSLFPNPAVNSMTVSVQLQQTAKKVTYEIVDGLGRFVSKEEVYNIQKDEHVINTSKLAPGNYYMILSADNNILSRKFTIVK